MPRRAGCLRKKAVVSSPPVGVRSPPHHTAGCINVHSGPFTRVLAIGTACIFMAATPIWPVQKPSDATPAASKVNPP